MIPSLIVYINFNGIWISLDIIERTYSRKTLMKAFFTLECWLHCGEEGKEES